MTKEFDERNAAKSRRVCAEMAEAANTGKRVLTDREREILDMWPKFEDGQYVMPGDEWLYLGNPAKENTVSYVTLDGCGAILCSDIREQSFVFGERVKRPAPEDSWERLEEDAEFNDETGIVGGNLDIVRRAKALAGAEVSE